MLAKTLDNFKKLRAQIVGLFTFVIKHYASALVIGITTFIYTFAHAWYLMWKDAASGGLVYEDLQRLNFGTSVLFSGMLYVINRFAKVKNRLFRYAFDQALLINLLYMIICYIYTVYLNDCQLLIGGVFMLISTFTFLYFVYKLFSTKIA